MELVVVGVENIYIGRERDGGGDEVNNAWEKSKMWGTNTKIKKAHVNNFGVDGGCRLVGIHSLPAS